MRNMTGVWVAVAVLGLPATAAAHKMEVDVLVTAAEVRVVAGYEGGEPSEDARVTLSAAAGGVTEGRTDDRGVCVLPRPAGGDYTLAVDDGAGHRVELPLSVPADEPDAAPVEVRTDRRNRWAMAAVGVGVIAGGTLLARRLVRPKPRTTV